MTSDGHSFRMEGSTTILTKFGVDVCWGCSEPLGLTHVDTPVGVGLARVRQCGSANCAKKAMAASEEAARDRNRVTVASRGEPR